MTRKIVAILTLILLIGCASLQKRKALANSIHTNQDFNQVKKMAREVVKTGFNAGDGYREVWIRDYNTFIELSAEVFDSKELAKNLLVFFKLQDSDGSIVDGFVPKEKATSTEGGYTYIYSDLAPTYAGHKNTVETDQESSLVQAVYKYINKTGDSKFLNIKVGDLTVSERVELAMQFLMDKRWSETYGLVYGATTADWGDVQHTHP